METGMETDEAVPEQVESIEVVDDPKQCSVMFGDIVNSTGLKETQTETAWVKGTTFLYNGAYAALVPEVRDIAWTKFLGDAVMAVVPANHAAELLRSAIRLLELVNDANRGRAGGKGEIDYNITVGIATGPLVQIKMPDGRRDFIGHVPDKASRLASIATPNALLVDVGTVAAANMTLVNSRIGHALERPVEEYLSPRESAQLRGFAQQVDYHEILWAKQFFGVKSENLTSTTVRLGAAIRSESPPAKVSSKDAGPAHVHLERLVGVVKTWNAERGFGFATSENGEDFHISPPHMVYQEDLPRLVPGQKIAFVAGPAATNGRSRQALAVLVAGREAQGYITSVPQDNKPYGWIKVVDLAGNAHPIFMSRDGLPANAARGMVVDFRVEAGPKGAYAVEVQKPEEEAA